ncbi:Protein of unknown function [Lachnospiraceae bacterium KH1T2]|nr:Protein of unknown function [Lachnospiraceae bacterium KH1T2]
MPIGARKLTNSSDETPISNLFSGDLVFGIPYFQRAYKWSPKNIERFEKDLENLLDYEDTSHFLGAIIVFGKATSPSESSYYEVIDGQQRLTTCYLSLIALAKTFLDHGMIEDAIGLYQRYLVVLHKTNYITNAKLICCKEDRAGINCVFHDLTSNSEFLHSIQGSNEYKPMPDTGNPKGKVWTNYSLLCKFFEKKFQENEKTGEGQGKSILQELYTKLVEYMSVVQIVVKDPTDGPKIFDSLNSKQEPMTIGDLVRNELFSRLADKEDDEIDRLDRDYWHPFYEKFKQKDNAQFDKVFEQYFFPYVLTLNHNIKKADAFNFLRERWAVENSPKKIIEELSKYQDIFLDLHYGTKLSKVDPYLEKQILNLAMMECPTSVYPFIMHVVGAVQENVIPADKAQQILIRVESFLVRRVVCGYEPTGLHAAFKSLWDDCEGDYSADNVVLNIRKHPTVKWPDNEEFEKNIISRPMYKVRLTPYILAEWNGHLGGDVPELHSQQIEHVLPDSPAQDSNWFRDWGKDEHKKYKDCIANLLPISGSLNASIQNAEYEEKKLRYSNDSALKAPREFAKKYDVWTPIEFESRAKSMVEWAIDRWKY